MVGGCFETAYQFGDVTVTGATLVAGGAAALFFVLTVITFFAWRKAARRAEALEDARDDGIAAGLAELRRNQGEITGHVRGLSERLDGFGHRVGQSMADSARGTHESLAKLGERLAVIDKAQRTITDLSSQVVELQHILANKQTRGAFGQARMEAIVRDGLPSSGYAFQATLSNGNRPDCLVLFPNGGPSLVIDAKFPLEAWSALRAAETPEAKRAAESQFRRDTLKHVQDIAERYLVLGETQDTAFMFVPSEVDLLRHPRALRGHRPAGAPGAGGDRLAVALDAVDPGGDVALARRAHARAGAHHPAGGHPADGRRRPPRRPCAQARGPLQPGQQGRRGDPDPPAARSPGVATRSKPSRWKTASRPGSASGASTIARGARRAAATAVQRLRGSVGSPKPEPDMVRISILYPNRPDGRFDIPIPGNTHAGVDRAALRRQGLSRCFGRSRYWRRGARRTARLCRHVRVPVRHGRGFIAAFGPHAEFLQGDMANYTDIAPVIQFSDVAISEP